LRPPLLVSSSTFPYVCQAQADAVISSDFEQKFVCGEIMSYDDLREYGTEAAVKAAGKLRQQGKTCELPH
jgi:obg-like ATPase 1